MFNNKYQRVYNDEYQRVYNEQKALSFEHGEQVQDFNFVKVFFSFIFQFISSGDKTDLYDGKQT